MQIGRCGMLLPNVQRPHEGSSLENMIIEFQLGSDVRLQQTMESVRYT